MSLNTPQVNDTANIFTRLCSKFICYTNRLRTPLGQESGCRCCHQNKLYLGAIGGSYLFPRPRAINVIYDGIKRTEEDFVLKKWVLFMRLLNAKDGCRGMKELRLQRFHRFFSCSSLSAILLWGVDQITWHRGRPWIETSATPYLKEAKIVEITKTDQEVDCVRKVGKSWVWCREGTVGQR